MRSWAAVTIPRLYNRCVYLLYNFLFFLALIVSTPWWLLQMWRHGKYRTGWRERLGLVPDRLLHDYSENTIWVHAVSVGEVLAISRVIKELKAQLPGLADRSFHHHRHRPAAGAAAIWRGRCFLPAAGFVVRGAGVLSRLAAADAGPGRKRILAKSAALGATLGSGGRGGERARLRPIAAGISSLSRPCCGG